MQIINKKNNKRKQTQQTNNEHKKAKSKLRKGQQNIHKPEQVHKTKKKGKNMVERASCFPPEAQ